MVGSCSNTTKHNYLLSIAAPQQITLIGLSLSWEDVENLFTFKFMSFSCYPSFFRGKKKVSKARTLLLPSSF